MCNQCFSCQTASSTVTLQLWCSEVLVPLFGYATPLPNTRTGLREATVPWKGGRTVHLVLLLVNSDRGLLLASCSCISTCCTLKWPGCPNLPCSLSRARGSRVVWDHPVCSLLIPFSFSFTFLSVLLPCSSLLRVSAASPSWGCTADGHCQALLPKPRIPLWWWSSAWKGFWHSAPTSPTTSSLQECGHPWVLSLADWQTSKSLLSLLISLPVKPQPLAQAISIKLGFPGCVWTALVLAACGVENGRKAGRVTCILGFNPTLQCRSSVKTVSDCYNYPADESLLS